MTHPAGTPGPKPNRTSDNIPAEALRFHALDSLRAVMMLLGIYFHTALAYSPIGPWFYRETKLTSALIPSLAVIHLFRMPIFYVAAGFFFALLCERRGLWGAAGNRIRRILLPFLGTWALLFPLVVILMRIAESEGMPPLRMNQWGTNYLWFLAYLLILYCLISMLGFAVLALPPRAVSVLRCRRMGVAKLDVCRAKCRAGFQAIGRDLSRFSHASRCFLSRAAHPNGGLKPGAAGRLLAQNHIHRSPRSRGSFYSTERTILSGLRPHLSVLRS